MIFSFGRFAFSTLSLFIIAVAFTVNSQDLDDVTISGRIADTNGLSIVGATVRATEVASGTERTVTSNEEGRYRFIELKPGTYKIKASSKGFGAKERIGLTAVSGQNLQLDFSLAPADVQAEATVTVSEADAPVVDITRTIVGGTVTQREIEEIPINTRNPLDLVLTLGGTSEEQLSTSGLAEDRFQNPATAPLEQGNFSLSGGVAYSNNITIDGLDNNDDRSSRDRFQPSLESIDEVQVISNQFSAEYGRASGGRVNLRTRAGGNTFRGRLFMFFRDDNLNANTWYNNSRNIARTPLTEYNPGFTFSGPVILPFGEPGPFYDGRKKTFFSVAYEYLNLQDSTFIDTFVPVGSNPRFPLPGSNAPCPVATCSDTMSTPATPILPFQQLVSTPNLNHSFTARVDHNFNENNTLTLGFQLGRRHNQRTTFANTQRLDEALQMRNAKTEAYNFTDNHVFNASVVNQLRGQYSIYEPSFQTTDPFGPVVLVGYTNPIPGEGNQTLIAGNSTAAIFGDSTGFPQNRNEKRYQLQDALTWLKGMHAFKTGFDVQKIRSRAIGLGDATGTFNFSGVLNFQNNEISRYRQNFGTVSDVENTYWGVFFNDEMRLRPSLTLSVGLRYERETAVSDNDNFGPRIGVAWSPFKDGKGVVRLGTGIFYNRVLLRTVADSIQNTGGNLVSYDTNTIGTAATDPRRIAILNAIETRFPNAFASVEEITAMLSSVCPTVVAPPAPCTTSTGFVDRVTSTGNPLRTVEADLRIPESYQFNVGFERELIKNWVFEANYTINKTVHLWRDYNGNVPVLPPGYSDWTEYLLANDFLVRNTNGTTRRYDFVLGPSNSTTVGPCSFTANVTCTVNLNTTSTSTAVPLASFPGNNNNATGAPLGIALAAIGQFRPDPTVSETSIIGSMGNAFYQGLILELRSRFRRFGDSGFAASFRFAYTLSKTMDDGLNNTSNAEINRDFSREWARSLQDRRHRIAFSGVFDTPWWMGRLRFSPLFRYGSSAPFNLGNGGNDRNLDDLSTDRINFFGDLNDLVWRAPGSSLPTDQYLSQFSLPTIGAAGGNLPRNAGTGPSFYTFDLNVTREWKFGEKMRLKPNIQFDNILNAAVFNYGAGFIDFNALSSTSSVTAKAAFLVPTRTYRQRQIRLGVRFDF
jgi:hypothetical protein